MLTAFVFRRWGLGDARYRPRWVNQSQICSSEVLRSDTSTTMSETMVDEPREDPIMVLKREAAYKAVDDYVRSGMVIGLGTGSTAYFAVERVGRKIAEGDLVDIRAVATSERTAEQARSLGIQLTTLDAEGMPLEVTVDGADTADLETFGLVKGGGGALLREKIVADASEKFVVVVDGSKISDGLGAAFALPVEVIQYSHDYIRRKLEGLPSLRGCEAVLRVSNKQVGIPFVTDNGNYIVDLKFRHPIADPELAAKEISSVVGVVEHGLFLGMASTIVIAEEAGGVKVRDRPSKASP